MVPYVSSFGDAKKNKDSWPPRLPDSECTGSGSCNASYNVIWCYNLPICCSYRKPLKSNGWTKKKREPPKVITSFDWSKMFQVNHHHRSTYPREPPILFITLGVTKKGFFDGWRISDLFGSIPWLFSSYPVTRPGKHTKNYGKSPCLMEKSTISMATFNKKLLNYQRVCSTTGLNLPGNVLSDLPIGSNRSRKIQVSSPNWWPHNATVDIHWNLPLKKICLLPKRKISN